MEMLELKKNTFYKIMKEYEEVNQGFSYKAYYQHFNETLANHPNLKSVRILIGNRETSRRLNYKLTGLDKDGKEKELEFNIQKHLRKEVFLRVYYSDKKVEEDVSGWEEVKQDEIPAKVKEKLAAK